MDNQQGNNPQINSQAPQAATQGSQKSSSKMALIVTVVILVCILIAAAIAYVALGPKAALQLKAGSSTSGKAISKDAAPDITVTNAKGESVSLSSAKGTPVILNFWASTCGPCQKEMPEFQKAFEAYGDKIMFVMVDIPGFLGETQDRANAFIEDMGYTLPVYYDELDSAASVYGVNSIPRTYFIDADGDIVLSHIGMLDRATLEDGIKSILQ